VLEELLAVIRRRDDHGVRHRRAHGRHDLTEARVRRGDLRVVPVDVTINERELGVRLVRLERFE
jgi:hypothetical protein